MSRETSDHMAIIAGTYLDVTEEEWCSIPISEQLKIVHSLAGSVLSQREREPENPDNPQDENP